MHELPRHNLQTALARRPLMCLWLKLQKKKIDIKLPPKLSENPVVQHVKVRMLFSLRPCYRAANPQAQTHQM